MYTRIFSLVLILMAFAVAAMAAGPPASPYGAPILQEAQTLTPAPNKAFGEPTDFKAAALAARHYLRLMQSDVSEDNALNGDPDDDPQDAGWDWSTTGFSHTAGTSSGNLHGVIAHNLMRSYDLDPDPFIMTTMMDVVDRMLLIGPEPAYPTGLHYPNDIIFLLEMADRPGMPNAAAMRDTAVAIWDWRVENTGDGTAEGIAVAIRDGRGASYPNGIIPWDIAPYVAAAMRLDEAFPGMGYDDDAIAMAEVLYDDSFLLAPGFFDFDGRCKGYDTEWANTDYYWYTLGIQGLIEAFTQAGVHLDKITLLTTRLLECQYPDGAFSYQYGAAPEIDDTDWQATGYCQMAIHDYLPHTSANLDAMYRAGAWLASTQDASGGFVYSSGNHYPEVGSEAMLGMVYAWDIGGAAVTTSVTGADPAQCGVTKTATFAYARSDGTPGLFGYEITLEITGPVTMEPAPDYGFEDLYGMDYFQVVDQGGGVYSVNGSLFGAQPGILDDVNLFDVDLLTDGDGAVDLAITGYKLRDPQNAPFFADMSGAGFLVDCTAPDPVTDIVAMPGHQKVEVDWTHDGADVDHYEVFTGLWYDTTYGSSAYPEYDDLAGDVTPTRPADYAAALADDAWSGPTVVSGDTDWIHALAARGVYYYEVFAVDEAGNASPPAAANDRATNYWLGDVNADGVVDAISDITALGACFGTADPEGLYDPYCDVGPTDDWSRLGVPLTDSVIDFEDLMVFSMNFSVVTASKDLAPISQVVDLAWIELDDGRMALRLIGGEGLKGLRVRAAIPVGTVTAGELVDGQTQPVFFRNVGGFLDANVAVMGANRGFVGTGDLIVVDAPIAASDLDITVRGTDNSKMSFRLDGAGGAGMPLAFALDRNYPNPFNPSTKISFSLPEAQDVVLSVYGLDGRRVATLLREPRGAGSHDVVWNGFDDDGQRVASGTYVFRIEAGPYSRSHKMTLLK